MRLISKLNFWGDLMKKWYQSKKVLYSVIGVFLLTVIGGYVAIDKIFLSKLEPPLVANKGQDGSGEYKLEDVKFDKDRVNVLLLAVDARHGEKSRTDTIIVASFNTKDKTLALISVPRDTRAKIPPGYYDKINAAYFYGDVDSTKGAIENLLGIPIHYYLLSNFGGFKNIIDTLGGVTLDVEKDMALKKEKIDLKKGLQELDGDKALQYVRFRSDSKGDIGRTERQQKFLKALADEVIQLRTIPKIPKLVKGIAAAVETDMSITDITKMANLAFRIDKKQIVSQTVPGNFTWYDGLSFWGVNERSVKQVVRKLLEDGTTSELIDYTVTVQSRKTSIKGSEKTEESEQKDSPPKIDDPNTQIPKDQINQGSDDKKEPSVDNNTYGS